MRKNIMLCYPFEERRLAKWKPPYIVQPKLDGDRCRALFNNDCKVILLSSEENEIKSVPHINAELERLKLRNIELDGELYIHGKPHNEIHSIVSRHVENIRYDSEETCFHVFDLVASGTPQDVRLRAINFILSKETDHIKKVPFRIVSDLSEIMLSYEEYIENGFEGFVIRNKDSFYERKRSLFLMKFKPKKHDVYKLAGWIREFDKNLIPKDPPSLGSIVCAEDISLIKVTREYFPGKLPDGFFSVGSGLTREQRKDYWDRRYSLADNYVLVKYQHISPKNKVPLFPVFVKVLSQEQVLRGEL